MILPLNLFCTLLLLFGTEFSFFFEKLLGHCTLSALVGHLTWQHKDSSHQPLGRYHLQNSILDSAFSSALVLSPLPSISHKGFGGSWGLICHWSLLWTAICQQTTEPLAELISPNQWHWPGLLFISDLQQRMWSNTDTGPTAAKQDIRSTAHWLVSVEKRLLAVLLWLFVCWRWDFVRAVNRGVWKMMPGAFSEGFAAGSHWVSCQLIISLRNNKVFMLQITCCKLINFQNKTLNMSTLSKPRPWKQTSSVGHVTTEKVINIWAPLRCELLQGGWISQVLMMFVLTKALMFRSI